MSGFSKHGNECLGSVCLQLSMLLCFPPDTGHLHPYKTVHSLHAFPSIWFSVVSDMGLGSNVTANDNTVLELHADKFPDVYTVKSTEAETLDITIASTSSGTVCVYRPDHS